MRTRGEGVKKSDNFADIISGNSPRPSRSEGLYTASIMGPMPLTQTFAFFKVNSPLADIVSSPRGVGACLETALDIFTSSVKAAPLLVFCEEKREFFTLD